MAKFENKITALPFFSGVSSTQFGEEKGVPVLDLTELSPDHVSRQGDDLLIRLPDGQIVRIDGFFNGNAFVLQTTAGGELTPGMLQSMFPLLGNSTKFAQVSQNTQTDAGAPTDVDPVAVARVKESAGEVKVVRAGSEIKLQPGDLVLDGDILVTGENARAKLEFFSKFSSAKTEVLADGSIGPDARITITLGEMNSANKGDIVLFLSGGNVVVENVLNGNSSVIVVTEAGRILSQGLGVGVSILPVTGETIVIALQGASSEGNIAIQSSQSQTQLSLPGQAVVLSPGSGVVVNDVAEGLVATGVEALKQLAVNAVETSAVNDQASKSASVDSVGAGGASASTGTKQGGGTVSPEATTADGAGGSSQAPVSTTMNPSLSGQSATLVPSAGPFSDPNGSLGSSPSGDFSPQPSVVTASNTVSPLTSPASEPKKTDGSSLVTPPIIPDVSLALVRASFDEAEGNVQLRVEMSSSTSLIVKLTISLQPLNGDLRLPSATEVVINPGETGALVDIPITPDFIRQLLLPLTATIATIENGTIKSASVSFQLTDVAPLSGSAASDLVQAGDTGERIDGGGGSDTLVGGLGDDFFVFDQSDAVIDGGGGRNTLLISNSSDLVTGAPQITNISQLDLSSNPVSANRIELSAATIVGMLPVGETTFTVDGDAGDVIHVTEQWLEIANPSNPPDAYRYYQITENGQTTTLRLGGGVTLAATLTPAQDANGNDLPAAMVGGSGGDNLTGGTAADTISGGEGADTIAAGAGADSVDGGTGDDSIDGGDGNDTLVGGAGNDTLMGGGGDDLIDGGAGADVLSGGDGNDTFVFDAADTSIDGGTGNNTLKINGDIDLNSTTVAITNISQLDLSSNPASTNRIELSAATIAGMLPAGETTFTIDGEAGDVIHVTEQWLEIANPSNPPDGYRYYQITENGQTITLRLGGGVALAATLTPAQDSSGNDLPATMIGGSGGDNLTGGTAADTISGGEGADTIAAGAGADSVDGGTGDDNIDGGDGNDTILGGQGADSVTGGEGADSIDGGDGGDTLSGGTGNDTVDGGAGNDLIDGGEGADVLNGGDGDDVLVFDSDDVAVNGGAGSNSLKFGADVDLTNSSVLISNIQTLDLTGTGNQQLTLSYPALASMLPSGAGTMTVEGNTGDNVVLSDQWIKGSTVNGYVEYARTEGSPAVTLTLRVKADIGVQLNVEGTNGNDSLVGEGLSDTLSGGAGNDTLNGGAGADSLLGGSGDDRYIVDHANDAVVEVLADGTDTGGTDTVETDLGSYALPNAVENLIITGVSGASVTGNGLANTLTSGVGNDTLMGGAGNDIYIVASGDTVTENLGEGTDTVKTDSESYTLAANLENLEYTGSTSTDLTGNDEANQITGGNSADTLRGGLGHDTLDGGAGADTLEGGSGDDVYLVDDASDTTTEGATEGTDTVQTTLTSYTLQANIENLEYTGSGNATLIGNSDVNRIAGGAGNDLLDGGAGADSLLGGLGNDTLVFDASDTLVDGGDGSDTLFLKTATTNFLTGTLPTGIEVIQMTNSVIGGTASSLTLSAVKVRAMLSSGNDVLIVEGDAGDAIEVTEAWTSLSQTVAGYNDYTRATADGTVILRMKAGILLNQVVSGTTGDDTLPGGLGNDNITGLAGNDLLTGADGDDILKGDADNDTLDGGLGNDTMYGGSGDDIYVLEEAGDVINEESNNDTSDEVQTSRSTLSLAGYTAIEHLTFLSNDNSTGTGNDSDNRITGKAGDDALSGGAGNDTLIGNGGNDQLDGGTGTDSMAGGTGSDFYRVDEAGDVVTEALNQGDDTIETGLATYILAGNVERLNLANVAGVTATGNALANTITGNIGNDNLSGAEGSDTLFGAAGNDTLDGGTGEDSLVGGAGNDIYIIDNVNDVVDEGSNTDTADEVRSSLDSTTLAENIEKLTLLKADGATGIGNALDNLISGAAGDDSLRGAEGNDTLEGAGGNDSLEGGVGNDSLVGGDSNDLLDGGEGNDTLDGGAGNDVYLVDSSNDSIVDASGTDEIRTTLNAYTIAAGIETLKFTGPGDFAATGTSTAETLIGGSGADTLDGQGGADRLEGGFGNDRYLISDASATIIENAGEGIDEVVTGLNNYILADNVEKLTLTKVDGVTATGNTSANTITGNTGNDNLSGGAGKDTLIGAAGDDTLSGGSEADYLEGGDGNDVYYVEHADDQVIEAAGQGTDTIHTTLTNVILADNVENLIYTAADFTAAGTGNFKATGNAGDNSIVGGSGNDTLDGGAGADTLVGGEGNDIYIVDASDTVTETGNSTGDEIWTTANRIAGAGIENLTSIASVGITLTGNTDANTLKGNVNLNLDDTLQGGDAADTLYGYAGNDSLEGGTGADSLIGGAGNDIYRVDDSGDVVVEGADSGLDKVFSSLAAYTLAANVEDLVLTKADNAAGTGNALDNIITGAAGNDTLDGAAGNDTLIGGDGNDVYITDGNDVIVESGSDTADEVRTTVNFSLANLSTLENLTSVASTGLELTGNAGVNILKGNDTASAANGADTLDGGAGADSLYGYDGDDVYIVDNAGDQVFEDAGKGIDEIKTSLSSLSIAANVEKLTYTGTDDFTGTGGSGNETITAATGNDTLIGLAGDDSLSGGAGNDLLRGGAGNDTLSGGDGVDIADYSDQTGPLTLNFATGTATIGSDTDTLLSMEGVIGTAAADNITGGGGNDFLDGNGGNDVLTGGDGDDIYVVNGTDSYTIVEGAGANSGIDELRIRPVGNTVTNFVMPTNVEKLTFISTDGLDITGSGYITGGAGSDTITTSTGNDTLDGGVGGNDDLRGGDGDDVYIMRNVEDVVTDSAGTDEIRTDLSTYTITANVEKLTYIGTGNFFGTGAAGDETITGGAGNDTLAGLAGNDSLVGGDGFDIADYSASTVAVDVNIGSQTVTGGAGNDSLNSIEGVVGSAYADTLIGSTGDDYLNAGSGGADTLTGGSGNDVYVINHADAVSIVEAGNGGFDTVRTNQSSFTLASFSNVEGLEYTGSSNVNLLGNTDGNLLSSGTGADTLEGGDGNDTLNGGTGVDTLIGGAGNDLFIVDGDLDIVTEGVGGGTDTIRTSLATYTLAANVENLEFTGAGAVSFTGSNVGNALTGGAGNDMLDGAAGNDTLTGGTGDDIYYVDSLADSVVELANGGTDEARVSVTGYTLVANVEKGTINTTTGINLTGNTLDNTLVGNTGNDTLDGGAGQDTMQGGAGDDVYVVDNLRDVVTDSGGTADEVRTTLSSYAIGGSTGIEKLTYTGSENFDGRGDTGSQTITGGSGDDTLDGGAGADRLVGGNGSNIFLVDEQGDTVVGGAGTDEVRTSAATLTMANMSGVEQVTYTGSGDANLTGSTGNDILVAGIGKDTLTGGTGNDTLRGGANNDIYIVDSQSDVIEENAGEGVDEVKTALNTYALTAANVEKLSFTGTGTFTATGNASDNVIAGGSGNDILDGGVGADTLVGGAGNDIYYIDNEADVITEGLSGGSADEMRTTLANITLAANVEKLTYIGTTGFTAAGTSGADSISGGGGNDSLSGLAGNDTLSGGEGNDTLDGGTGTDSLVGGAGDDVYVIDSASDVVVEGVTAGTDEIRITFNTAYTLSTANVENLAFAGISGGGNLTGDANANKITGGDGNDTLSGAAGNDTLIGGAGQDSLSGGADNDSLAGGDGNDTLIGGAGSDTLAGGAGADIYRVDDASDTLIEISGDGTDTVETTLTSYTLTEGVFVEKLAYKNSGYTGEGTSAFTGTGNSLDNEITGGSAADNLKGLAGNDTLTGGAGNDTLDGGTGIDSLVGGAGNDVYIVDNEGDIISETGSDTGDEVRATATSYVLGSGIEKLTYVQSDGVTAGTGDFTGTGSSGNETITGGSGNDYLSGMAGNDKLVAGDGNNTLDGGAGTDTLEGGAGNDLYVVDSTSDVVTDTGGTSDEIRSTASTFSMAAAGYSAIENLSYSGLANANLTGNASNNVITGSVGDDTLDGGTGIDTLVGGAGNDVYKVDNAGDLITENGSDTADEVQASVSFSIAALANIENLTSTAASTVTLTGNDAANVIKGNNATAYAETLSGGLGNDTLYGYGANDSLDGGDGNDSLDGGIGDDTLTGGAGNDTLVGGAGNDIYIIDATSDVVTEAASAGTDEIRVTFNTAYTLAAANVENLGFAGTGDAILTGDANANQITGGAGNDILAGAAGNDTLIGNAGDDSLDGGAGQDSLSGGDGNDVLDGGNDTVADTLVGGLGNDIYVAYATADTFTEAASAGSDTIRTALSSYTLASANIENLEFTSVSNATGTGDSSANTITGNIGNDTLSGAAGNDTIYGGAGNDSIDGGAGDDSLIGGLGNDVYVVDSSGDVIVELADEGIDEVKTALTTGYTLSANIEKLTLSGSSASGTGNDQDNTITGAAGNDTLSGAAGNDTLMGAAGNDILDGGAGNDSIDGGDGNDRIIYDSNDLRIEGGVGTADSLVIAGTAAVDLSVTGISGTLITNIEEIDLRASSGGTGANQVFLNATAVKALSSTTDTLLVHGDFGDRVVMTDGWTQGATTTYNSISYNIWTSNSPTGATLHVSQDVTLVFAIYGTSGDDSLSGGVNSEVIYGYAGNDTLNGGGGNDSLLGAEGNDTLDGGAGSDTVLAGDGSDILEGGSGGDNLYGDAGDDTIYFDANDVLVDGGDGNDSLLVKSGATTIDMTLADDAVFKNIERFDLSGQGAQLLKLSVNDLKAINSAFSLQVDGDIASDNVRLLGANTDWTVTNAVSGYVTYSRDGATVNVKVGVDVGFVYPGSALADNFTGSSGSDEFSGLDGDDSFAGGAAIDLISGGTGNDSLLGDAGNDLIDAGAGDDAVEGGADNDSILGGAGNDLLYGDDLAGMLSGNDTIVAAEGNDTVYGGQGSDSLSAGLGDDRVYGDAGNDTLDGSDGYDLLSGGDGNDSLVGGINDDTLMGGAGNDTLDGGAGAGDWADFSGEAGAATINLATGVATIGGGTDTLFNIENVRGNSAANTITGSTTGNRIDGMGGSDSISAGDGTDAIVYYAGDTVDGGTGTDTLVIDTGDANENTIELDLTTLADTRILNIEEIDMTANPASVLKLNEVDLKALSSTTDILIVHGNANDVVVLAGTWVSAGTQPVTVAGVSTAYNKFTLSGATILINPLVKFAVEITGSASADNLTGSTGEDTLRGGAGNDTIDGLAGRDALYGDSNDDTIKYDNADATVDGGLGVDTLQVVVSGKIIDLQIPDRRPVLSSLEKIDLNTTGANYLVVDAQTIAALATETSTAGNLTVIANTSDFIFVEGTRSGTGPYTITTAGVSKTLTISGSVSWGNYIRGTSGDDSGLNGVASATPDLIHGDAGNDTIDGLSGTDIIYGDAGNDVIVFDNTDLLIDGGEDADTLQVAGSGVTVDLTAKADDIIFNVETIDLTGTGNNTLTLNAVDVAAINTVSKEIAVTGNAGDVLNLIGGWVRGADVSGNQIFTLDGSKVLAASALTVNINWTGTALNDTLVINDTGVSGGDRGAQNIVASDGNDRLDGKGGADTLSGGNGDDVLVADIDSSTLTIGDASVDGGAGLDTLVFTSENQKLDLTTNSVTTTHGEDKLKGIETIDLTGTGANIVVLGANDLLNLSDTTDTLILNGDANDTMRLSGTWVAAGSAKVNGVTYNQFTATASNGTGVILLAALDITRGNVSVGGVTADALTGGAGSDALSGMAGNDTLNGAGGSDELYGGNDDDLVYYDAADQIADGGAGSDTLSALTSGNIIDLQESARPTSGAIRPSLINFEQIELNSTGANYLIVDSASFRTLTGISSGVSTLTVSGTSADIVFVDGTLHSDLTLSLSGGVTQQAVIAGTSGDDTLTGSIGIDAIKGGAGKDVIDAGAGADIVYGQAGDDVLVFDAADLLLNGGDGIDTLLVNTVDSDWNATSTLNTSTGDIDFTVGAGTKYVSIETIDLTGNGHQTIRLDEASVLAMSPTGVITVKGNNDATDGDTLKLYGAWVNTGVESGSDGNLYYVMQKGDAFVKVDKRISLGIVNELGGNVAIGTDGADIVTVPSGGGAQTNDGDDTIFINDTYFTGVDGGRGYDTVKLATGWTSGNSFNATLMAPSSLTNIEQIDLTGRGTNKLILSAGNVLDMTDSAGILVVTGDTADSVEFRGTWTLLANVSYNGVTYKDYSADNGAHVYYQTTLAAATFANPTPQLNIFSVDYRNAANFTNVGIDQLTGIRVENVGDANGDKITDFVINQNGQAYLIFGGSSLYGDIDLDNLGTKGIKISNVQSVTRTDISYNNYSTVSDTSDDGSKNFYSFGVTGAGDVNGDGLTDLLVAVNDYNANDLANSGETYAVIYGRRSWADVDAKNFTVSNTDGFRLLNGPSMDSTNSGQVSTVSQSVSSLGDINGDGYADFLVANSWENEQGYTAGSSDTPTQRYQGKAYVVFGSARGANLDLASPGSSAISLTGVKFDNLGADVASVGDINNDGFADFVVGAPSLYSYGNRGSYWNNYYADANTDVTGGAYVVFGKASGWANVSLARSGATSSSNGYIYLDGGDNSDYFMGRQVQGVGDVNGDGIADFVVGTASDASPQTNSSSNIGKYYLVFGKNGAWDSTKSLATLVTEGKATVIAGAAGNMLTSIATLGDFNKDGYADLLVTAAGSGIQTANNQDANASDDGDVNAGAAFLVYGKATWTGTTDVTNLGSGGLEIAGGLPYEQFGFSATAGDFNGDGKIDLLFGQPDNHRNGFNSGAAYLLAGGDYSGSLMSVGTASAETMVGDFNANTLAGQGGNDAIYGLGGADILRGGTGNDTIGLSDKEFILLDGGTGTDLLKFIGHGIDLDMTGIAGASLRSFEQIDLTGDGNNSLTLNYREVLDLLERKAAASYGTQAVLTINGDAGDVVTLESPWFQSGTSTINSVVYNNYLLEGMKVQVAQAVTTNVVGWTIPKLGAQIDLNNLALNPNLRTTIMAPGGGATGSYFGTFNSLGDVNNDGYMDFIIGSSNAYSVTAHRLERVEYNLSSAYQAGTDGTYTSYRGEEYVIYGKAGGLGATADIYTLATNTSTGLRYYGGLLGEQLGSGSSKAAGGIGDINGDGIQDFAMGSPFYYNDYYYYAYEGYDYGTYYQTTPTRYSFGDDFWGMYNEGRVYIVTGKSGTGNSGGQVSTAYAINPETAASYWSTLRNTADSSDSTITRDYTNPTTVDNDIAANFMGVNNNDFTGLVTSALGDVNGDGYDDYIYSQGVDAKLVMGGTNLSSPTVITLTGMGVPSIGSTELNRLYSAAGDVNGDGYDDFYVSNANGGANKEGEGWLVFGRASNWTTKSVTLSATASTGSGDASLWYTYTKGSVALSGTGHRTSSLGDINGDGYDDLLFSSVNSYSYASVGSTYLQTGDTYEANHQFKQDGASYLMLGGTTIDDAVNRTFESNMPTTYKLAGATDFERAGWSLSGVGDVNGDGYDDLVMVAPGETEATANSSANNGGSSYLIFGKASGWANLNLVEIQNSGLQILGKVGYQTEVMGLGDVDGDGLDDIGFKFSNYQGTTTAAITQILYGSEYLTDGVLTGVQHQATTTGATLTGTGTADRLIGNSGNDTLNGGGGADVLYGGMGNDVISITDSSFLRIDGGTGTDILKTGFNLNLNGLGDSKLQGIEVIDMTGGGVNTLTLTALEVLNMTEAKNMALTSSTYQAAHVLVVTGDSGDVVDWTDSGWINRGGATGSSGYVNVASQSFTVYQHGSDNIYVAVKNGLTWQ